MAEGGCQCGNIRYSVQGDAEHAGLCHCVDCRASSGAPMMAWAAFPADQVKIISGKPSIYNSSEHGRRHFCDNCGTGLFYTNEEMLTGITDVQSATLDDPNGYAPGAHIQTAERIEYMETAYNLHMFERYPG